jgi:hypothetical protein
VLPRWLIWPIFALVMGFAIGGSVFWGLYGPNTTIEQADTAAKKQPAKHSATEEKEKADEALARYTFWLTLFTGVLAFATICLGVATVGLYLTGEKQAMIAKLTSLRQFRQTRESIALARQTAEAAEQSVIEANRAWIKVDIQVGGPIHYNVNGANFTLIYVLENVGNSPALNVEVHPRLIDAVIHARTELLKDVELRKELRPSSLGYSMFPGDRIKQPITVSLPQDQIKEATKLLPAIYPTIIGTVTYRMGLDDACHQTGFLVEISRNNTPRPFTTERNYWPAAIWVEEGDVPADQVRLIRSFLDGGYAD